MTLPPLRWECKPFDALHPRALYALLRLRTQVFVIEQQCVFQDMDGADANALHLLGYAPQTGLLCAYARLFAPGVQGEDASFGRVITHPQARGQGLGHALVREALAEMERQWGSVAIHISAQAHLVAYYAHHGFVAQGPIYQEDGIAHQGMRRAGAPIQEQT